MTHVLTPKAPEDTVSYVIPWVQQLRPDPTIPSDVISSYTLTVTSGSVTVASSQNLGFVVQADIAGGIDGETSGLHCQIVTVAGQTLNRDLTLLVRSGSVSITPETTTKRQVIGMAFEELGLADYEFNTSNEEKATALRRLDSLMALWAGPGFNLDLGYNFPSSVGGGNLGDAANVPDSTLEAVSSHLAARLAPIIGKALSPETRTNLNRSLNALRAQYAVIPDREMPRRTIRGSGQKPWSVWSPFFQGQVTGGGSSSGGTPTPPATPLSISGTPNPTVTAGSLYLFTPSAIGGTGALTFAVVNLPAWATFNATTGQLAGIPSSPEVDTGVQIGVHDSLGIQAWLVPWTITVSAAGTSPSLDFSQPGNSQYIPQL